MISLGPISGVSIFWLAAGALAMAAPLAIHMLSRRRGRRVDFPPAKIFHRAEATRRRLKRLRDLIALAARMSAIGLLALAFSDPLWTPADARAPRHADGRDVVVLLDRSASMRRSVGGEMLFDAARREAAAMLDRLDGRADRAAIVLLDNAPRSLTPELTRDMNTLTRRARAVEPSFERGRSTEAIALARRLLDRNGGDASRERQIVAITDGQRSQWIDAIESFEQGASFELRVVGAASDYANAALTDAHLHPPVVRAGDAAELRIEIHNFSDEPATAAAHYQMDDRETARLVELPPGGSATASFEVLFERQGMTVARVWIGDDAFEPDNALAAPIIVHPAPRFALLAGGVEDPHRAGHYALAALRAVNRVEPEVIGADQPVTLDPARFDGAVVADRGGIDEETRRWLETLARRGGVVVWFVDSSAAAEALAQWGASAPATVTGSARDAATIRVEVDPLAVAGGAFRELDDPALWEGVRFRRVFPVETRDGARPLLTLGDGVPIAAMRPLGDGAVVVIGADIAPARSTFTRQPAFPALMAALLRDLSRSAPSLNTLRIGDAAGRLAGDDLRDVGRITRRAPGGETGSAERVETLELDRPGAMILEDERGAPLAAASVLIDPAESDLRPIRPDELPPGGIVSPAGPTLDGVAAPVRLAPWLLLAALGMVCVELLASRLLRADRRTPMENG